MWFSASSQIIFSEVRWLKLAGYFEERIFLFDCFFFQNGWMLLLNSGGGNKDDDDGGRMMM